MSGDVMCGSQTGLGGEGASYSGEPCGGQERSDVDGSEVASAEKMSWWVSSALSFLYCDVGTFFFAVCSRWQSWVDAARGGLRQTDR